MNRYYLNELFYPKSIAIVGVSKDTSKMGGSRSLKYLVDNGYSGEIYPINPKYDNILGIKCYPSIEEIREGIDAALIAIPANHVLDSVKRLAEKKVKNIIIFSSGFAETGEKEQLEIQSQILKIAEEKKINICGPNGQGVANLMESTPLTFSTALEDFTPTKGGVGLITQSGAIGTFFLKLASERNINVGLWASTGNEVDLKYSDYLEYMIQHEKINVISSYVEGIRNVEKFKEVVAKANQVSKPIVLLKVGRTSHAAEVAASHTSSMTGADDIYDAFFKQKNIIRAVSLYELMDYSLIFSKLKSIKGKRIAILTTSGGIGVLAVDFCEEYGLEMAKLTSKTIEKLSNVGFIQSFSNPVDIGAILGKEDSIYQCIKILQEDDGVDSVLFFTGVAHSMGPRIAKEISEVNKKANKPLVVSWMAPSDETKDILMEGNIPYYDDPLRALKALSVFVNFHIKSKPSISKEKTYDDVLEINEKRKNSARKIMENDTTFLNERKSKQLLQQYNIQTTKGDTAENLHEAIEIANGIGYPVVMKIESPDIIHKTEVKGVRINIQSDEQLEKEYLLMLNHIKSVRPSARINGVYIEEMVEDEGLELICGVSEDPTFGKYLLLGRGGIEAELYQDVSRRILPLNEKDVREMLNELIVSKLLRGYRNMTRLNENSLIELILNLSHMIFEIGHEIKELDFNPILVSKDYTKVLDARIILNKESNAPVNKKNSASLI